MISFYDGSDSLTVFEADSSAAVVASFDPPKFPTTQDTPSAPNPMAFEKGITCQSLDADPIGANLYVAVPGGAAASRGDILVPIRGNYLTSSGDEDIDIDFSTMPTAVGFDFFTNGFHPLIVSVFNTSGTLLATFNLLPDKIASQGFLGIIFDVPIGKVNWKSTNGRTKDTGIANIRAGNKK